MGSFFEGTIEKPQSCFFWIVEVAKGFTTGWGFFFSKALLKDVFPIPSKVKFYDLVPRTFFFKAEFVLVKFFALLLPLLVTGLFNVFFNFSLVYFKRSLKVSSSVRLSTESNCFSNLKSSISGDDSRFFVKVEVDLVGWREKSRIF